MVTYINYTTANVTSFPAAINYTNSVIATSTGITDLFGPLILIAFGIGFLVAAKAYGVEKSVLFTGFMTSIVGFLMVSANILTPWWLVFPLMVFVASVFFSVRD